MPNDTTTGSSRFGVPDLTTTSGDTLTSDAAGNLLKTTGGAPDPSSVISAPSPKFGDDDGSILDAVFGILASLFSN